VGWDGVGWGGMGWDAVGLAEKAGQSCWHYVWQGLHYVWLLAAA